MSLFGVRCHTNVEPDAVPWDKIIGRGRRCKGPHQRGQFDRLHVDDTQCQCIHCSRLSVSSAAWQQRLVRDPLKAPITWRVSTSRRHNLEKSNIA